MKSLAPVSNILARRPGTSRAQLIQLLQRNTQHDKKFTEQSDAALHLAAVAVARTLPGPAQHQGIDTAGHCQQAGAGGGMHLRERVAHRVAVDGAAFFHQDLMDQNIVVINKAGGSGAEAFVEIASNKIVFGTNNAYLPRPDWAQVGISLHDVDAVILSL
jgi:putative tricarboxylic transport membrane protein